MIEVRIIHMGKCFQYKGNLRVVCGCYATVSKLPCNLMLCEAVQSQGFKKTLTDFFKSLMSKLNLFSWEATMQSNITYPTLCYHHSLRPTKAPKCSVRRQIGFTYVASPTNVRDVIAVVHMHECSFHNLKERKKYAVMLEPQLQNKLNYIKLITTAKSGLINEIRGYITEHKCHVSDTHTQGKIHGISCVAIEGHIKSHHFSVLLESNLHKS